MDPSTPVVGTPAAVPAAQTPSTTQPAALVVVIKPTKPIMGDLAELKQDLFVPWTGGKPASSDWKGLDSSARTEFESPNQLRSTYANDSAKSYNHRRRGDETKFKKGDSLSDFQTKVWNHLEDSGMDSIAYLQDPEDSTVMTDVVKSFSRYTILTGIAASKLLSPKFDKYDRLNDAASKTYLLDSLDTSILEDMMHTIEPDDTFAIVWLRVIEVVQSMSIERFNEIKERIKKRHPKQYPGEDVAALTKDLMQDAKELTIAGQYDHNLTLTILELLLLAGGSSGTEDYTFPLRSLKIKLDAALLMIAYKTKQDANKYMETEKLTYKAVCGEAVTLYRKFLGRGQWHPARSVVDHRTPPRNYGANVARVTPSPPILCGNVNDSSPLTKAQVLTLIHQSTGTRSAQGSTEKPGVCHNCNKPGHWRNQCPEL
eukprot:CAMPEP_0198300780 /NCGR_PEP_ID=MMETSP1449-20131203/49466_1 /TAXON_ID=420275 /ORGANISM="Attheya septentrionalis, Strain CCMP2084" /LENGTH=427 /DNA_ID=CAMNT_0044002693 /DNA_START=230 /DNA_END=1510 /DNA_ORIENTATION=+